MALECEAWDAVEREKVRSEESRQVQGEPPAVAGPRLGTAEKKSPQSPVPGFVWRRDQNRNTTRDDFFVTYTQESQSA